MTEDEAIKELRQMWVYNAAGDGREWTLGLVADDVRLNEILSITREYWIGKCKEAVVDIESKGYCNERGWLIGNLEAIKALENVK